MSGQNSTPASADRPPDRLVWIDLEMTGLDVERDVIVEIAALVTDAELEPLDDGIDLVVRASNEALASMDAFVRTMHTKSGLLAEIEAAELDVVTAGAEVLQYIARHVPAAGVAPICGNSIGMDRRFLARYLPDLDQYLHYRSIDVSSIKELARRWYPEAFRARPGKKEGHRALADVQESIAELRYYRAAVFR